jgi:site-specific DNA-cytosine methylase
LFSSAIIFAPQNKVQGAEASKISKLNNSSQKLFSEDFGVPQKRHRAFFFGVRNDIGCEVDLANSPVFHFKKYAHVNNFCELTL